jgi:hypothetical protein
MREAAHAVDLAVLVVLLAGLDAQQAVAAAPVGAEAVGRTGVLHEAGAVVYQVEEPLALPLANVLARDEL